jgi:hypothetical protein
MVRAVGGGEVVNCSHPQQQSQKGGKFGGKMNILKETIYFLHCTDFKLLSHLQGNSVNYCDSLKLHNFSEGW